MELEWLGSYAAPILLISGDEKLGRGLENEEKGENMLLKKIIDMTICLSCKMLCSC